MRKILAIALLIILVFSLCSCGEKEKTEKICTNCDKTIAADSAFCQHCGATVGTTENNGETVETQSQTTQSQTTQTESDVVDKKPSANTPSKEETKPAIKDGEYTVTFDYGYDNKKVSTKSKNYKVAKPNDPKRKGYEFISWHAPNESEAWNFSGHAVTADMTLTAKWGKYVYYISYSMVIDGKKSDTLKERIGNSKPNAPLGESAPKFEEGIIGRFKGHSVTIDDGTELIQEARISPNTRPVGYDFHYFRVPSSFSVDSKTFTIPELKFDGLKFLGWTYNGQTTPVKTVTIPKGTAKDYNLVANWERK